MSSASSKFQIQWLLLSLSLHQVVCEATQCTDPGVRKAAYEAIWTIATLYYDRLQAYMTALFELTLRTIREDQEDVALNAMEFWSSLCDEEVCLCACVRGYEVGCRLWRVVSFLVLFFVCFMSCSLHRKAPVRPLDSPLLFLLLPEAIFGGLSPS